MDKIAQFDKQNQHNIMLSDIREKREELNKKTMKEIEDLDTQKLYGIDDQIKKMNDRIKEV